MYTFHKFIGVYAIKTLYICGMIYKNLKLIKVNQTKIAKLLGYKSEIAFRSSSAKPRIMRGLDSLVKIALEYKENEGK